MIELLLVILGFIFIYLGIRMNYVNGNASRINNTGKMYLKGQRDLSNHGAFVDRGMRRKNGKLKADSKHSSSFSRAIIR